MGFKLSSGPKMASYCSAFTLPVLLAALINGAVARQFPVGGSAGAGWAPPAAYNDRAGKYHLFVNDSLVFRYNPSVDSVVCVSAEEYNSCNISNPIASFGDGNTVFQFSSHGDFYFVNGNLSSCRKGEKVIAYVLSPGKSRGQFPNSTSPNRGPVKGRFWVDNFGCCQNNCCDGKSDPACCKKA